MTLYTKWSTMMGEQIGLSKMTRRGRDVIDSDKYNKS